MGQTRNRLQRSAAGLKGHLGTAYTYGKAGLERMDNVVGAVRMVHSVVAPHINHTREGAILNASMRNFGTSYDAIRQKVIEGDQIGNAVVSAASAVHKKSMGIGL